MVGVSNLRPLLETFASPHTAELLAAGVALLMLAIIAALAGRVGHEDRLVTPALAGIWSLATFYHLVYGFILLLPAAIFLRREALSRPTTTRTLAFWILQAGLVVDLPTIGRRLAGILPPVARSASIHADRLLMLLAFVVIASLASRRDDVTTTA
jgi:hypothetical protein